MFPYDNSYRAYHSYGKYREITDNSILNFHLGRRNAKERNRIPGMCRSPLKKKASDKIMAMIYAGKNLFHLLKVCTLWDSRGVSPEAFRQYKNGRLLALSQIFSRSLLTLDLVYHQTKALGTLTRGRGSRGRCFSAFADARHARIRRLAPCLRRHLPDDG